MASTKVPIKGSMVGGIKETPSQARARAQQVADAYEAADKEGEHALQVRSVVSRLAKPQGGGRLVTVRDYASRYLKSREGQLAPLSLVNARSSIQALLKFLGSRADMPLVSVSRADARAFVDDCLLHVRRSTVTKYLGYISPMFMSALDAEIVERNPFFHLRVPESRTFTPTKKEAFTPEEVRAMLEILPDEWRSMVICCLYLGGQRLGDIATLKWSQIDMRAGVALFTSGKTRREMRIPIIPALAKHLDSLPRRNEYIHPGMAEAYRKKNACCLSNRFRAELESAGIIAPATPAGKGRCVAPKTFHSLRATAATLLHEAGVDPALAREIVGHETRSAHQRYIRPDDSARRSALARLGDALGLPE